MHSGNWDKDLGVYLSFVHVADSMIATDAPRSFSPYPSRSSLQFAWPLCLRPTIILLMAPARSPSSDNHWKPFLDCRRPFIQATEELPVTSVYYSPDLKMIKKENNLYQNTLKEHILYLKKEKSIIREKIHTHENNMYLIKVSASQARKKGPIPFFLTSILTGKTISDFRY